MWSIVQLALRIDEISIKNNGIGIKRVMWANTFIRSVDIILALNFSPENTIFVSI